MNIGELRKTGDILYIDIKTDLSAEYISEFKKISETALNQSKKIVFNFQKLNYICSSGLSVLSALYKTSLEKGAQLRMMQLDPKVKVLFDRIRLTTLIPYCDDEEKAAQSFLS